MLYELALEIGQTLDVNEACERFLQRLMSRKSQDVCVLWADMDELRANQPGDAMDRLYACPQQDGLSRLSRANPLWQRLRKAQVLSVTSDDALLRGMPGIDTDAGGIHSFIALADFGCVYLHSRLADTPWDVVVRQQLAGLADKFAISLRACFNYQVLTQEIQARRRVEQELAYRAEHDALTGLANRACAQRWLQRLVEEAPPQPFVLMYADLDHFKNINDTMGHLAGDKVLVEIARRITYRVRRQDLVARLGGDEFLIVLTGVRDKAVAERVATQIIDSCSTRLHIEGKDHFLGCSIGITHYPEDATDVEDLMSHADSALYDAKRSGRNRFCHYHDHLDEVLQQRLAIETALRDALSHQEFQLVYQPIVNLVTGGLAGVEALLRWHSPELGTVPPDVFIPVAEDIGAIVAIGAWVLRRAARDACRIRQRTHDGVFMSVNVSSVQFKAGGFEQVVRQVLDESGLPPDVIRLEVTEGTLLDEDEVTRACIDKLHGMGLELSIDDFGTGYSALSYLSRIPRGVIKIDRSFVEAMGKGSRDVSLVKAIINMAHALERPIIAEGIETDAQKAILEQFGCDMAQGYFYGRPMPMNELMNWIARQYRQVPED